MFDMAVAVIVGVLAGSLGCAIRHRGATVWEGNARSDNLLWKICRV